MKNRSDEITIQYYKDNAESFVSSTINTDMGETWGHFLSYLPQRAHVLDFGCGSGRDTKHFLQKGYTVDAVDGSPELCRMASEYTGVEVKQMLFQELNAVGIYDGAWACASILHLPKDELAGVLHSIATALKEEGILYASFKYGTFEGLRNGRYFTDFTEESLRDFWNNVPELELFNTWITKDVRPGREEERWINLLAKRS